MKILIRTDGGLQIGNGHIIRMLALANELTVRKIDFAFALKLDDFWITSLTNKGLQTFRLLTSDINELSELIQKENITHFIYDTRNDLVAVDINLLKEKSGVKIIVIDSPEDVRLAADVNLYPPIPQVSEWKWNNFKGENYSGWEFVLLRSEFSKAIALEKSGNCVLLSFGSTDPFLLTEWVLHEIELNTNLFTGFEFILLVGPQFNRLDSLQQLPVFKNTKIRIIKSPNNLVEIFQSVTFAIIALGVTAYELATLSVPFLFISISDDHAKSGEVFETSGLGYSLGTLNKNLGHFAGKVTQFMSQREVTKNNLKTFSSQNRICDWSKIISAIIN